MRDGVVRFDVHLGRRNCQRFLQRYFVLPLEAARQNPVFAATPEAIFQRYSITVLGTGVEGATTTNAAGIVMLTRTDTTINRWVATIGTNSGLGLSFTDPVFGT